MTIDEVKELIEIRFDGKTTLLAAALDRTEAAIKQWFKRGEVPKGATSTLLGIWLTEARARRKRR